MGAPLDPSVVIHKTKPTSCLTCRDTELRQYIQECLVSSISAGKTTLYTFAEEASQWRSGRPCRERIVSHIKAHEPDLYAQIKDLVRKRADEIESESFIYFIEGLTTGKIKIGFAKEPERRMADLQIGSPVELRLLHIEPGGRDAERVLHAKFIEHRTGIGEWFDANAEILAYVLERSRMQNAKVSPAK